MEQESKGFKKFFSRKNLPKTSAIIIAVGTIIIIGAIFWGRSSFNPSRVDISIDVLENVSSGEEISLTVKYNNNNRVELNDVRLIVNYPQGSFSLDGEEIYQSSESIGTINKKTQGEKTFKIRLIGEKGGTKNIIAKLDYKPQNINSRFESNTSSKINISSVLVRIHVEGSEKAVAGQEISYAIEYENKTDETISNLRIRLEYPDDFSFKNSEPLPTLKEETDIWDIGFLKANEKKTINLIGVLNGQEMENKVLRGIIGVFENDKFLQYSQSEFITQISPAPIVLTVGIEGITEENCKIDVGQNLRYKINFKNNTDIALRELILKAHIKDGVFDVEDIELNNQGFFDSRDNTITWSGADIPALNLLETNQSGEVVFSIKIKDNLPIHNFNDKNFRAGIITEIQTLTVPAKFAGTELKFEKELSCKINTQADLKTKAYYYEPNQGISNVGPIPPRVNSLTNYTIHWQVTNTSNDLDGVIVKSILPQGISYTDSYVNKSNKGQIYYNDRTNEIIWNVGRVSAGVGITIPMYEMIFQIGLTPSVNQVGEAPTLINESQMEGKDLFTGINITKTSSAVDTSVPDDLGVGSSGKRVTQ